MMPGQSGWEVCKSIREHESTKGTKIVMLTGIGERMNEMTSPLYTSVASPVVVATRPSSDWPTWAKRNGASRPAVASGA
jgi:CheY-like chemotaxis protein